MSKTPNKKKKSSPKPCKHATRADEVAIKFREILTEMKATPGEACGGACAIIKDAMEKVPQINRQEMFIQMAADIEPQLH